MTFESGNSYDLIDPDLRYFITNTNFDREIDSLNLIYSFLNDMKYNINFWVKKSIKNSFIKALYSRQHQLQSGLRSSLHDYEGCGSQSHAGSNSQTYTNQYVFLPSDPDELVGQLS